MAEVRLEGVSKSYGSVAVVRSIDLVVPSGGRCVLLGPSGCGKTTTLRMVAGLENPQAGVIRIDGQVVADPARRVLVPPEQRGLGMVFQSYALWPHLSVFENVAYPLRRAGTPEPEVQTRVAGALDTVHLGTTADRLPHALSGGQQQRVALARAIVARPRVLLTDEPLSNLDARLRDGLRAEMAALCQAHGITLLHVTHDQAEALMLATVVAVMQDGRIAQLGPPEEIYAHPTSLYVARFLGDTHVLAGSARADGGVELAGRACGARLVGAAAPGSVLDVAVRPEDVRLEQAEGPGTLAARVVLAACSGPGWTVDVETEAGPLRLLATRACNPGEGVHVRVAGGHAFARS